jgi:hypothetical protein
MECLFITLQFFTLRQFEQLSNNTEWLHVNLLFVHCEGRIYHSEFHGCLHVIYDLSSERVCYVYTVDLYFYSNFIYCGL